MDLFNYVGNILSMLSILSIEPNIVALCACWALEMWFVWLGTKFVVLTKSS